MSGHKALVGAMLLLGFRWAGLITLAADKNANGPAVMTGSLFDPSLAASEPVTYSLEFSTYLGSSNGDLLRDMTVDTRGNIYVAGIAGAADFPRTPPEIGGHSKGGGAMVAKFSPDGKLVWSKVCGGQGESSYFSKDMPVTPDATGPSAAPMTNWGEGWLGKVSSDGSRLLFGTYIADAAPRTHNLALDARGNVFICTCTKNWPVTDGAFQTKFGGGPEDFGIVKFSPQGMLLAATYLGGNGDEINGPDQIVVDSQGRVVIAGNSSSTDYPITGGALQLGNAGAGGAYPFDGVVTMLSNDLSTLVYSSYIGGTGDEMARACCTGSDGTVYVGGVTTSRDFPVKNAFQPGYGGDAGFGTQPNGGKFPVGWGNGDCWLLKLNPIASKTVDRK